MAYIQSATTTTINLHITSYGREMLLKGNFVENINLFGLGDSDRDYTNINDLDAGNVPNGSGDNNGLKALNDGFAIRSSVFYNNPSQEDIKKNNDIISQVYVGFNQNGQTNYAKNAEVTLYLHDLFVLYKALAHNYISYYPTLFSSTKINQFTNYYTGITNSNGQSYGGKFSELCSDLENIGRGVFLDFYDSVYLKEGGQYKADDFIIVPNTQKDYKLLKLLSGSLIADVDGKQSYLNGPLKNKYLSNTVLSFSSREENSTTYQGAGPGGISFYSRDYGYFIGEPLNQVKDFRNFGVNSNVGGFYHPKYIEDNSNLTAIDTINKEGFNTILPAARIITNNVNTNYYYPINFYQSSSDNSGNRFEASKSNPSFKGSTFDQPVTSLSTYIDMGVNTEYIKSIKGSSGYDNIITPNFNSSVPEPWTLLTREFQLFESFIGFASTDPEVSSLITYSGAVSVFNATVNVGLKIYSKNNPTANPALLKLKINFNKQAATDSIGWSAATATQGAKWNLYDNSTVKFYGEGYPSSYTINPTLYSTTSGTSIFRKVVINV